MDRRTKTLLGFELDRPLELHARRDLRVRAIGRSRDTHKGDGHQNPPGGGETGTFVKGGWRAEWDSNYAARRKVSIAFNQLVNRFELVKIWATISPSR